MSIIVDKNPVLKHSSEELSKKLHAVVLNVLNERRALGLPEIYKKPGSKNRHEFIHEYPDGRKIVVTQTLYSSEENVLVKH